MLLKIRDFIRRARMVSTEQLAREFHIDEQALQPMLDIWVCRGVIRLCQETMTCKSRCFRCNKKSPVFYQFNIP